MDLKNYFRTRRLKIDKGIRNLIVDLWKHGYKTTQSCDGHNRGLAYLIIKENTGDGWFEENSKKYGLDKLKQRDCCEIQQFSELKEFLRFKELNPDSPLKYYGSSSCRTCGAGMNGSLVYRGRLVS